MIPIKGTQITSAVCKALHGKYSQIPIYREPIDQDFQEPCFFCVVQRHGNKPRHLAEVQRNPSH